MKLFVTGGGGFLGLALVRQLRARGHDVVSFSRGRYPVLEALGARHCQGDLSDYDVLKQAMKGCEAVFHTAAKTGIWGKYNDFYSANVIATENVLKACHELDIRYLVFTSSPSVVYHGKDCDGGNETLPYPARYDAHYPQTKAMAEKLVMKANDDSLKTVSLRPHLIWGPGDPHFIPRLFRKARAGKLRIVGHAPNLVDCIYIDNAVNAHVQAFNQLLQDPRPVEGKTYFISQGQPLPIAELTNLLISTGDIAPIERHISPWTALSAGWFLESVYRVFGITEEPPLTVFLAKQLSTSHWYDISAAKRDFGYNIEVSLVEGIERLRTWVKEANEHGLHRATMESFTG